MPAQARYRNPCEVVLLKVFLQKVKTGAINDKITANNLTEIGNSISGTTDSSLYKQLGTKSNLRFRLTDNLLEDLVNYLSIDFNSYYETLTDEIINDFNLTSYDNQNDLTEYQYNRISEWAIEKVGLFYNINKSSKPLTRSDSKIPGAYYINDDFIERVKNQTHEAAEFFLSKKDDDCQWYGIYNGWDATRNGYEDFKKKIQRSINNKNAKLLGLVYGAGGVGKSTVLRRLAYDCMGNDYIILWISNINQFATVNHEEFFEDEGKIFVIFIEDWYQLSINTIISKDLLITLSNLSNVHIVIGDRTITSQSYNRYLYNNQKLELTTQDNLSVLSHIQNSMPEWQESINRIKDEISNTSIYLILFVLANLKTVNPDDSFTYDIGNIIGKFKSIVESDVKKINMLHPGIARALFYWASVYKENKIQISKKAFITLAKKHEPTLPEWVLDSQDTTIKKQLNNYVNFASLIIDPDKEEPVELVSFNHDLLAESGLAEISIDGFLFDNNIKKEIFFTVVNYAEDYSASIFFDIYYRNEKDILTEEEFKIKFELLFSKRNKDYHYLINLFDFSFYTNAQKIEKLQMLSGFSKFNNKFGAKACKWIQENLASDKQKSLTGSLLNKQFWNSPLFSLLFDLLNETEKLKLCNVVFKKDDYYQKNPNIVDLCLTVTKNKIIANQILQKYLSGSEIVVHLIAKCINIVNDKKIVNQILQKYLDGDAVRSNIICRCIDISNNKEIANQILQKYLNDEDVSPEVIPKCIAIANNKKVADQILQKYLNGDKIYFGIICNCIDIANSKEIASQILQKYLDGDEVRSEIICICIDIVCSKEIASQILLKYLAGNEIGHQLISRCMDIANDKKIAEQILQNYFKGNEVNHQIISKCIDVAGDKNIAEQILKNYLNGAKYNHAIISRCINISGDKKIAEQILQNHLKGEKVDFQITCRCISLSTDESLISQFLYDTNPSIIWSSINSLNNYNPLNRSLQERVNTIIRQFNPGNSKESVHTYYEILKISLVENKSWQNTINYILKNYTSLQRKLIGNAIIGSRNSPVRLKPICKNILFNCRQEIDLQLLKKKPYYFHILISLNHPDLQKEATIAAKTIYNEFCKIGKINISEALYPAVLDIVNKHKFRGWFLES